MKYYRPYTADASHFSTPKQYSFDETLIILSDDAYAIRKLKNFLEKNKIGSESNVDKLQNHVLH